MFVVILSLRIDPQLMNVSIDEKAICRAYSIKEDLIIEGNKIYQVNHIYINTLKLEIYLLLFSL